MNDKTVALILDHDEWEACVSIHVAGLCHIDLDDWTSNFDVIEATLEALQCAGAFAVPVATETTSGDELASPVNVYRPSPAVEAAAQTLDVTRTALAVALGTQTFGIWETLVADGMNAGEAVAAARNIVGVAS